MSLKKQSYRLYICNIIIGLLNVFKFIQSLYFVKCRDHDHNFLLAEP